MEEETQAVGITRPVDRKAYLRYLIVLSTIIVLSVFSFMSLNFQFLSTAGATLNEVQLASFLSQFYGYAGFALFASQLLLSSWMVRRYGVMHSTFILPITMLVGVLTMLWFGMPNLYIVAATFFAAMILDETIWMVGKELLYLPLPNKLRLEAQAIGYGMLGSVGKIVAGSALLAFSAFSVPVSYYLVGLMLGLIIWVVCLLLLSKHYKKIMLLTLRRFSVDTGRHKSATDFQANVIQPGEGGKIGLSFSPESTVDLHALLADADENVRRCAIGACGNSANPSLIPDLLVLLKRDVKFQSEIFSALSRMPESSVPDINRHIDTASQPLGTVCLLLQVLGNIGGEEAEKSLFSRFQTSSGLTLLAVAGALEQLSVVRHTSHWYQRKIEFSQAHLRSEIENLIIYCEAGQLCGNELLQDAIHFYFGVYLKILAIRYHAKEIGGLNATAFVNKTHFNNLLEVLDSILPHKEFQDVKRLFMLFDQKGAADLSADFPRAQGASLFANIDPWIRTLVVSARIGSGSDPVIGLEHNGASKVAEKVRTVLHLRQMEELRQAWTHHLFYLAETGHHLGAAENEYDLWATASGKIMPAADLAPG